MALFVELVWPKIILFALTVNLTKCQFKYPEVRRDESIVDDLHGTLVRDPYRWFEDPEPAELQDFMEKQNNFSMSYLEEATEERDAIRKRLFEYWNHPKYSVPKKCGNRYFYFSNSGTQNQMVLYTQETLSSSPQIVVDPNVLDENGTIAISPRTQACSPNGDIFAYGLIYSGTDWMEIKFINVPTGEEYSETLKNIYFTDISWTHDGQGIFYSAYPSWDGETGLENQKILYHRIGTEQSQDIIVVEFPDHPNWRIGMWFTVTTDGQGLVVFPTVAPDGLGSFAYYAQIPQNIQEKFILKPLIETYGSNHQYVTSVGSKLYLMTALNAPNQKLIAIDLENPSETEWITVIPEKTQKLDWVYAVDGDKLIVSYIDDVKSKLSILHLGNGSLIKDLELEPGTVQPWTFSMSAMPAISYSTDDNCFYFILDSFLIPNRIYMINFTRTDLDMEPQILRDVTIPGFDPKDFIVKQIFYSSKDNTSVPMYVIHKKDLVMDGQAPAMVWGYGGFSGISLPAFALPRLIFMENFGGIYVSTNLRGGGEYGEAWHDAGRLENKQNTFDDLHAAAEYLISNNYTNRNKLIIEGESNGGITVSACLNQRPDLYAAVLPRVGVYDLLRFHLFGWGSSNIPEFGNPDDPEQFGWIYKYSPLHNIRMPGDNGTQYPAVLVRASSMDSNVPPLHSYKYAAELQYTIGNDARQTNPLLLLIESTGHGLGVSTQLLANNFFDYFYSKKYLPWIAKQTNFFLNF